MEIKKMDHNTYLKILEQFLDRVVDLKSAYSNIIAGLASGFALDTMSDFIMQLDDARDKEDALFKKYKDSNYDFASLFENYSRDFRVSPSSVFDFQNLINIYTPNETYFLIRRYMNLIVNRFDSIKFKYDILPDEIKLQVPFANIKSLDVLGAAFSFDVYKVFLKLAKEEFDKDPSNNSELLFYMMDFIIANPNLEEYYVNNGFDFNEDVILYSGLLYEQAIRTKTIKYDDYVNLVDLTTKSLIINYNKYENNPLNRKVISLMIDAAYAVTADPKLEPFVNKDNKLENKKIRYLTFYNK